MNTLVLMVGGSGSGKSTVRADRFNGLPVVDCDEIKKEHAGFDPKNPALVHEWSSAERRRTSSGCASGSRNGGGGDEREELGCGPVRDLGMTTEIRREGGYWSLFVDGVRMVDRESFTVADRIRERVEDPSLDDLSEATEVARAIRDWHSRADAR